MKSIQIKLFFLLLLPFSSLLKANRVSLKDLTEHAQQRLELPKPDNNNYLKPNYESFYKSFGAGFITKIIPFWPVKPYLFSDFKTRIKKVIKIRREKGLAREKITYLADRAVVDTPKSPLVIRMQCNKKCNFIIWGKLQGAFHSLLRDLNFLQSQGIINNMLEIIKPDYYMVFNGDAVSRSPYGIETLVAILILMERNQDKVFYLQGPDEQNWENYGLLHELKIKGNYSKTELSNQDPEECITTQVGFFFKSLPIALYINNKDNPYDLIRLAPRSNINFEEAFFGNLFDAPEQLATYSLDKKVPTKQKPTIHANIISTLQNIPKPFNGLGRLLDQDYGAPNWSTISGPTVGMQKEYHIFNDSFTILRVNHPIESSTITLYSQDSRKKNGFTTSPAHRITPVKKRGKKDIVIGSSLSLVQGVPAMGNKNKNGMEIRIKEANDKGGINGHYVKLMAYNDNYNPFLARKNIQRFINQIKADLVFLPVGSPTLAAYLDLIKDNKTMVFFPNTGSPGFRKKELTGLIHLRASYADEVKALINEMITKYNARHFAFFYQDDDYGIHPFQIAKKILEQHNLPTPVELPYPRGSTDFEAQVEKVKKYEPDAIGFFSTGQAAQEFIRQMGIDFVANKKLFGLSFMASPEFKTFATRHGLHFINAAVLPNPVTSQLPIIKQYRKAMDTYQQEYDVHSLEAYVAADLLFTIMSQIEDPITPEKIMKKLQNLRNYSHKGLELSFDPEKRTLAQHVWVTNGADSSWDQYSVEPHAR